MTTLRLLEVAAVSDRFVCAWAVADDAKTVSVVVPFWRSTDAEIIAALESAKRRQGIAEADRAAALRSYEAEWSDGELLDDTDPHASARR